MMIPRYSSWFLLPILALSQACAPRVAKPASTAGNLKMPHCQSVKVAARAASKVYQVWRATEYGKAAPSETQFESFTLLDHFYGGDEYGGIAALFEHDGRCVLSWKGTDFGDFRDIKADLFSLAGSNCMGFGDGKEKPVGNCGVGFRRQHEAILSAGLYDKLRERLEHSCKDKSLLITGHSLGGALAALFSATLQVSAPDISERSLTVTFGAPRVFGPEDGERYHRLLEGRALRIVSYGDPVTTVPRAIVNSSMHFGEVIYLTTTGLTGTDWTYSSKPQNFSAYWNPTTVGNHKMANYIERVDRCHE